MPRAVLFSGGNTLWLPAISFGINRFLPMTSTYKVPRRTLITGFFVQAFYRQTEAQTVDTQNSYAVFGAYEGPDGMTFEPDTSPFLPDLSPQGPFFAAAFVPGGRVSSRPSFVGCRRELQAQSEFSIYLSHIMTAGAVELQKQTSGIVQPVGYELDKQELVPFHPVQKSWAAMVAWFRVLK